MTEELVEALGLRWRSIDIPPEKEGFYMVAEFEGGKLKSLDTEWIYVKDLGNYLQPNRMYSSCHYPTHYIPREEIRNFLELLPKEEKNGEVWL